MSVLSSSQSLLTGILDRVTGMKALIVDSETIGTVSVVLTQSQILEKEVFLVEQVDKQKQDSSTSGEPASTGSLKSLKAVLFLRPTPTNYLFLHKELATPRFAEYHVTFSNIVPANRLEQLAGADEVEVVSTVQELYCDFLPVNPDSFALSVPSISHLSVRVSSLDYEVYEEAQFQRIADGIFSACVAFKVNLNNFKYTRNSDLCKNLVSSVQGRLDASLAGSDICTTSGSSLLLLVDRREDPVTPLLTQWTYQAMIHELLGLDRNKVSVGGEMQIFNPIEDSFYRNNLFTNFGDISTNVKQLVDQLQSQTNSHAHISTIADMQAFMEAFPDLKKHSGNVNKHVSTIHAISQIVEANNLLTVSALEQDLACEEHKPGEHIRRVLVLLADPKIRPWEKLKLGILYALKYFDSTPGMPAASGVDQVKEALVQCGIDANQVNLIDLVLQHTKQFTDANDLFKRGLLSATKKALERSFGGAEQNIYTQHKSYVASVAEAAIKTRLKDTVFAGSPSVERPDRILLFVVGGFTFEEARDVAAVNATYGGNPAVILGGSFIHNAKSYLADLAQLASLKPRD